MHYILKRAFYGIFVLIGLSILMFVMVRVMPGDPIGAVLGPMATEEDIAKLRSDMGLDRPIYTQYFLYIKGIFFERKLGMSLIEHRDVSVIISERVMATIELVLSAIFLATILAIPLGVIAATHKNRLIDHLSRLLSLVGLSFPQFWLALVLQLFLSYSLGLFPLTGRIALPPPSHITGLYLLDSIITLNFETFKSSLMHLICPAIVLSLSPLANIARLVRASMLDELSKDYAVVAQVMSIPIYLIKYKYVLRNAFSSSLTMIGFMIPLMIGNAFVVETVFAWPGIARFGTNSILNNDFNGIMGIVLVIGLAFVVINIFVDALYIILDPRIGLKR